MPIVYHNSMTQLVDILILSVYIFMGCQHIPPNQVAWPGIYAMEQVCDGATNPSYTMEIRPDSQDASTFYLVNVGNYGEKVKATVQNDSLIITPTKAHVGLMGSVRLSGTGRLQRETLLIQLTVEVPGPQNTTTTSTCELHGTPARQ